MSQQIIIGRFPKGLTENLTAFNIDNDAFATLFNAYVWRGRVKRKRGTALLGRLTRQIGIVTLTQTTTAGTTTIIADILNDTGVQNPTIRSIQPNAQIAYRSTGSIIINVGAGTATWNDATTPGVLTPTGGTAAPSTINYATGRIVLNFTAPIAGSVAIQTGFNYFPDLPVMGLRDFLSFSSGQSAYNPLTTYPLLLAFDQTYSYQINQSVSPPVFYNVNYYKTTGLPFVWHGTNYQQFWTVNYNGALWATNGNPGMQFEHISTIVVGAVTTITTSTPHGLIDGDVVFFYEITGTNADLLNGISATVTVINSTTFTVPINTTGAVINNAGIFQTMTNTPPGSTVDGIRWYDGDPTNKTGLPTGSGLGWVNFAPPLTETTVSINNETPDLYYLVGATFIVPFKDRLLFFGPSIQTSQGNPIYLPDTVIFSWNGTPYYSNPTPTRETFDVQAYYVDVTGFGGWIAAGISQEIITVSQNEDVLIVGFTGRQTRFAYTGDDILPFVFFSINSEHLGSGSTFSGINLDRGVLSIGENGIIQTSQVSTKRIDLEIPDQVFTVQAANNGPDRVNSIRDYQNEWVYFSYPVTTSQWVFPSQTFMYNYRDEVWSILSENYTARGYFRLTATTGETWLTLPFEHWTDWTDPWVSGAGEAQFASIASGNQQGFVMLQDNGTGEGPSGYIQNAVNAPAPSTFTEITSHDHCLIPGDYVLILSALGTTGLNGEIGQVLEDSPESPLDEDTFTVDIVFLGGTYGGNGTFTRLSIPFIQTKQFNPFWELGRQVRLGPQRYLFDKTPSGQITVNINLSQDSETTWNAFPPNVGPTNTGIEYSQIVFTCPEGTNLGLTPANINLQMPVATAAEGAAQQVWHRMNTSLQGDSVQLTVTLSDAQMRDLDQATAEIALHAIHMTVGRGPLLA